MLILQRTGICHQQPPNSGQPCDCGENNAAPSLNHSLPQKAVRMATDAKLRVPKASYSYSEAW